MTRLRGYRLVVACLITSSLVWVVGGHAARAAAAVPASASAPVRIAVAPFEVVFDVISKLEPPAALPNFGKLLAGRLALRDLDRLIAPSSWVAERSFEPHAEQVRRWAHSAAVDTVIVGRVLAGPNAALGANPETATEVEVVVRSGHSGAELFRHQMTVALADGAGPRSEAGWAAALDPLAAAILGDLGGDARVIKGQPALAKAAAARAAPPNVAASVPNKKDGGDDQTDGGLASKLDFSGFASDAPIEINADEAEIVSRGEDRRLIFQSNVRVKQANILLVSDRLEADYRKGESEPRQLIAQGHVKINQGERKARCDKAIYSREAQQLTCKGHAELIQGCDVVRGESIEFDLAGDQARVQGAASIVIRPEGEEGTPANAACTAGQGLL